MAFPILGSPKPAFSDSSGDPLESGTLSILEPTDDSNKTYYPTADDADAGTNGASGDITLNARGETPNALFGINGEKYKIVLKDSSGSTIYTVDDIKLPLGAEIKYKATDESVTSSTTLQNDDDLASFTVLANQIYRLDGLLNFDAAADGTGIKISIDRSNTATDQSSLYVAGVDSAGTAASDLAASTGALSVSNFTGFDDSLSPHLRLTGTIFGGSTDGTLTLQWAQASSSANALTLYAGSWISLEKIS